MIVDEIELPTIQQLRFTLHAADDTYDDQILTWLQKNPKREGDEWAYFCQSMTEGSMKRLLRSWLETMKLRGMDKTSYSFLLTDSPDRMLRIQYRPSPKSNNRSIDIKIPVAMYDKMAAKQLATDIMKEAEAKRDRVITERFPEEPNKAILSFMDGGHHRRDCLATAYDRRGRIDRRISAACTYIHGLQYWTMGAVPHRYLHGLFLNFQEWARDQYSIFLFRQLLNVPKMAQWPQQPKFCRTGLERAKPNTQPIEETDHAD